MFHDQSSLDTGICGIQHYPTIQYVNGIQGYLWMATISFAIYSCLDLPFFNLLGGFKHVLMFLTLVGICWDDARWAAYFSDGLKPPTRWPVVFILSGFSEWWIVWSTRAQAPKFKQTRVDYDCLPTSICMYAYKTYSLVKFMPGQLFKKLGILQFMWDPYIYNLTYACMYIYINWLELALYR
jgi:hypothetical protein